MVAVPLTFIFIPKLVRNKSVKRFISAHNPKTRKVRVSKKALLKTEGNVLKFPKKEVPIEIPAEVLENKVPEMPAENFIPEINE
ncbi:hypothetical protein AGMMS49953_01180 [Endomicrobiia bacterium]|nr:hypothetical protein AGMMS49953_01180 [Endomicrobiia bacterium]